MELWIVLGALYALQCVVWLPQGAIAFVRLLRCSWVTVSGPSWCLLHLLPSGATRLATRLPLCEHEGRLHGRSAQTWLSDRGWHERGPAVEAASLAEAESRGRSVFAAGRLFARALTREQADAMSSLLRTLGRARGEERAAVVAAALEGSLSLERYRDAAARVERATRWLRWSSDLYWVALFAGLPLAFAFWDSERAILLSLPGIAALHVCTLAALVRAFTRLLPGRKGALLESVLAAAFYPPLLLRALHDLRARELAVFHPAAVASAELPTEAGRSFLRAEIVRAGARAAAATQSELGLDALECRALERLAGESGESAETLLAPPQPQDRLAESYCPACLCEYRRAAGTCTDCGLELAVWPVSS